MRIDLEKILSAIILVIILSILLYKSTIQAQRDQEISERVDMEYKLKKETDSINGIVLSVDDPLPKTYRKSSRDIYLTFQDSTKALISVSVNEIGNYIKPGDILQKRIGSDTLFVFRRTEIDTTEMAFFLLNVHD